MNIVKSENFCENFTFANNIKRHICVVNNLPQGHDLPLSVKDRVISQFRKIFFHKAKSMHIKNK